MISRRQIIKWGAVAPVLAAGSNAALANGAQGLDAWLIDTRYAPLAADKPAGVPVLRFAGDVTKVWFDTIDPAWRQRGFVLGGITGSDTLFVLENLARQQGRSVVSRHQLGRRDARGVSPISWIIAPTHPSVTA